MKDGEFNSCRVPLATTAFVWPTKADFDRLDVPEKVFDWGHCDTTTLLKRDGRQWERRCHAKTVEDGKVSVIFQWFEERVSGGTA